MRFSRAVRAAGQAVSIKYNTMVYDLQRRGEPVIVMSLGEAFFDLPLLPMDDLPFPQIYHYSHSRGIPELRECLARLYSDSYRVPVDPASEILVTAGSKAAIHMAFMATLDPGDEVLIPEPAWVSYVEQVKLCHARPVGIPYQVPPTDWHKYVTPRTRAVVLNSPHNPRGCVYTEAELSHLLDVADRHGLWVFSDEAYSDFVEDGSFVSMGRVDPEKRRTIVFNSISKNHGISGWRIGYLIARPEAVDQVLKVNQHLITCPPTILCYYVARHFDRILDITRPQIRAVVEKRNQLVAHMDRMGLGHLPGGSTFYAFVSTYPSRLTSDEFCTRLLRESLVSTVPGIGYGDSCDGFIRVSAGAASMAQLLVGLGKIKELIERTGAADKPLAA